MTGLSFGFWHFFFFWFGTFCAFITFFALSFFTNTFVAFIFAVTASTSGVVMLCVRKGRCSRCQNKYGKCEGTNFLKHKSLK